MCRHRSFAADNSTLGPWAWGGTTEAKHTLLAEAFESAGPLYGALAYTPGYQVVFSPGVFFSLLYVLGIPLFFTLKLSRGRSVLNHTRFGRKYGYLYKRYEVEYYYWEVVILLRKVLLSVVRLWLVLPNGDVLPVQQAALGMVVVLLALLAQA